jgi:hypothetical protein
MTEEQKPRKVIAKKGVTKKSTATPEPEAVATQAASAAPTVKARAKAVVKSQPKTKAKSMQVSIEDVIRLRAYEIYLQRGATPGDPHEDWDVAEREVRAHFGEGAEA